MKPLGERRGVRPLHLARILSRKISSFSIVHIVSFLATAMVTWSSRRSLENHHPSFQPVCSVVVAASSLGVAKAIFNRFLSLIFTCFLSLDLLHNLTLVIFWSISLRSKRFSYEVCFTHLSLVWICFILPRKVRSSHRVYFLSVYACFVWVG